MAHAEWLRRAQDDLGYRDDDMALLVGMSVRNYKRHKRGKADDGSPIKPRLDVDQAVRRELRRLGLDTPSERLRVAKAVG